MFKEIKNVEAPSYYAIIPANVRYDSRLSANEKLMFGEITCLCNKHGVCWSQNNYFAKLYEVSPKTVSVWVNNLKKYGYIEVDLIYKKDSKEIEKRIIRICENISRKEWYPEKPEGGYPEKSGEGIPKNREDNITSINNTSINNISSDSSDESGSIETGIRIEKKVRKKKEFIPPTLQEVIDYKTAKNLDFDAEDFYSYYTNMDWKDKFGSPVLNWKSKILNVWCKNKKEQDKKQEVKNTKKPFDDPYVRMNEKYKQ